jgi:hypothetical protein
VAEAPAPPKLCRWGKLRIQPFSAPIIGSNLQFGLEAASAPAEPRARQEPAQPAGPSALLPVISLLSCIIHSHSSPDYSSFFYSPSPGHHTIPCEPAQLPIALLPRCPAALEPPALNQ